MTPLMRFPLRWLTDRSRVPYCMQANFLRLDRERKGTRNILDNSSLGNCVIKIKHSNAWVERHLLSRLMRIKKEIGRIGVVGKKVCLVKIELKHHLDIGRFDYGRE